MYDNNEISFDLQNRFNMSIKYLQKKELDYCNIKITSSPMDS